MGYGRLVALTLVMLASSAGLFRVFVGTGWVGPVAATVICSAGATWAVALRWPQPIRGAIVGICAATLAVSWTVFPSTTSWGVPTFATLKALRNALASIGPGIATAAPPVHVTPGFALLAAGGAGLLTVAAIVQASQRNGSVLALFPSLAMFIAAIPAARGGGRFYVVSSYCVVACGYLYADSVLSRPTTWFGGVRRGGRTSKGSTAVITTLASVILAASVTAMLPGVDGSGVLGWGAASGGSGQRIVPNPLVSLQTRLLDESNTPVFQVRASVGSYWQLTTLDSFDGTTWSSEGSYSGFSSRLPGVGNVPSGVQVEKATFTIQNLDSVWLPDQFNPVSVQGAKGVSYDPGNDSLLVAGSTSNGMSYTVTSYRYLADLSAAELASAAPTQAPAVDTALPTSVPQSVKLLAQHITANSSSEYAKALAIQDYLTSPIFRYTLQPPTDGSGTAALTTFLFDTRAGYCQQFAAAFAVLAREVGIPTRLGVGFATGSAVAGGFQVLDSDAHTWPEVFFGPQYGWVPFEPTPGFSVPGANGYDPVASTSTQPSPQSPTTVAPANPSVTVPAGHEKSGAGQSLSGGAAASKQSSTSGSSSSSSKWWLALAALAALAGLVVAWVALAAVARFTRRRMRRARASRAGPRSVALTAWQEAEEELAWIGVSRREYETVSDLVAQLGQRRPLVAVSSSKAARAGSATVSDPGSGWGEVLSPGDLVRLSELAGVAEKAAFAREFDAASARAALNLSADTARELARHRNRRQRIRRWLLIRPRPKRPYKRAFGR
ncbi:MAG: transglutaminaseTgpA domain-containing protein [Acidimicrobiales bacterium]